MSADEPVDVRLVPAALAVWCAAVAAVRLPPGAAAAIGTLLCAAAAVTCAGSGRAPRRHRRVRAAPPAAGHAVLVLGAVGVLLLATSAQLRARDSGGLRELADARARVELAGTVRSAPLPVGARAEGGAADGTVRFLLAVTTVTADAEGGEARADRRATRAAVEVYAAGRPDGLVYGARVRVVARLSPPPGPGARAVARARAVGEPVLDAGPGPVLGAAARLRAGLAAQAAAVPGDAGRLLPAVAVGDTSVLGDVDEAMTTAGLAHLTAVSGAHFSLLGALVLGVSAWCGVPRRLRWAPTGLVMLGFVALVQPGPSVVRAGVMGAVGVLGIVVGRPSRSVPALAVAVLVLLVVDPWLATDLGFVLSAAATAGIALLAGPLAERWAGRTGRPIALALAVPVAAQAACGPVVLLISPVVPTYAVVANVLVAPAVAPATVLGLLVAVLEPWWPAAAAWCAQLAGAACWWLAAVARAATSLPGAQLPWVAGPAGVGLLAVAGAAAVRLVLRCRPPVAP